MSVLAKWHLIQSNGFSWMLSVMDRHTDHAVIDLLLIDLCLQVELDDVSEKYQEDQNGNRSDVSDSY